MTHTSKVNIKFYIINFRRLGETFIIKINFIAWFNWWCSLISNFIVKIVEVQKKYFFGFSVDSMFWILKISKWIMQNKLKIIIWKRYRRSVSIWKKLLTKQGQKIFSGRKKSISFIYWDLKITSLSFLKVWQLNECFTSYQAFF